MIKRFEHFTFAINEIGKFLRKLSSGEMRKHGLRSSHAIYFTVLSNNSEKGLTASKLCELSGRDKADVSRMMTLLEKKGFVVKVGNNHNLYNGVFKLTDKGIEIANCIKTRIVRAVEIAGRDLTEEARRDFYKAMDSIAANLQELTKKGIPE